ncbi:MAG TPA: hypothetical protein VH418_07910 [Solirubrobacteraceae bacterium]|jgi:hypothetical protein
MADPTLKELLAGSSLAFVGTVRALGETPVAGLEADDHTAVVQVDEELHVPDAVDVDPGTTVTVQLSPDQPPLAVGDRATFFANPLVYGDTVAVTEVGRTPADALPPAGARFAEAEDEGEASPVTAALDELAQEKVLEHALKADAVVRGRVIGLNAVDPNELLHEHSPQWWIATLDVDFVQRGEVEGVGEEGGRVNFLYANSLDIRWRDWPKPKAGQGGMWILHRTAEEHADLAPFTLRHREDLQPSLQIELLR